MRWVLVKGEVYDDVKAGAVTISFKSLCAWPISCSYMDVALFECIVVGNWSGDATNPLDCLPVSSFVLRGCWPLLLQRQTKGILFWVSKLKKRTL